MYPFLELVAPIIRAISRATLGFSAMQTIILIRYLSAKVLLFFHFRAVFLFFAIPIIKKEILSVSIQMPASDAVRFGDSAEWVAELCKENFEF
jgi:hypothetical protein